jgi:hypothetical protein
VGLHEGDGDVGEGKIQNPKSEIRNKFKKQIAAYEFKLTQRRTGRHNQRFKVAPISTPDGVPAEGNLLDHLKLLHEPGRPFILDNRLK